MLKPDPNWRELLKRAWSIRLMLLAGLLSGIEVALPFVAPRFPPLVFAFASMVTVAAAFCARLIAQKDL